MDRCQCSRVDRISLVSTLETAESPGKHGLVNVSTLQVPPGRRNKNCPLSHFARRNARAALRDSRPLAVELNCYVTWSPVRPGRLYPCTPQFRDARGRNISAFS